MGPAPHYPLEDMRIMLNQDQAQEYFDTAFEYAEEAQRLKEEAEEERKQARIIFLASIGIYVVALALIVVVGMAE